MPWRRNSWQRRLGNECSFERRV